MPLEKRGARTDHRTQSADARRDEIAVGEISDANGKICVRIDEIDVAIGLEHGNRDVGKLLQERAHDRQYVQTSELHGSCDHESTASRRELPRRFALLLVHLFENTSSRGDVGRTRIGQFQLASGAREQARSKMRFEIGDSARKRRDGNLLLACSRGQTPSSTAERSIAIASRRSTSQVQVSLGGGVVARDRGQRKIATPAVDLGQIQERAAQNCVSPPSTTSSTPVTKDASSLARYSTLFASSAASPKRFIGTFA